VEIYAASETPRIVQGKIASFIGYWTGVLPLSLSDLRLHVPVAESISDKPEIIAAIKVYNNELESSIQEDIKLTSGVNCDEKQPVKDPSFRDDLRGGICRDGNDLRSLLIRYFCEAIIDCAHHKNLFEDTMGWNLSDKGYNVQGIVHRRLGCNTETVHYGVRGDPSIKQFLNHNDGVVLPFVAHALHKVTLGLKSLGGVMDHLVNRGHKSAPFVEGLTVELLPFQLQSLQWALERESVAGGIQSYFTAKIPRNDDAGDLYYNPITGKLGETAPKLVRGGIIAEQMVSSGGSKDT
jgi:hypothetical protein